MAGNALIWSGIYFTNGTIIQRDFNFPLNNENFERNYYPLWNDLTSQSNIERFPRIVLMSPFLSLSHLGLEMDLITKIIIVSSYSFLTLSLFVFLRRLVAFLKFDKQKYEYILLIGSFIAAYNPVNLQFLGGISFLISLAALPLMLFIVLAYVRKDYFPLLVSGALLLSLAHPFLFIMNAMISIIFSVIIYYREVRLLIKKTALTAVTFTLLFSWFIIPYYFYPATSIDLGRENQLDRETYDTISDNQVYKVFLLERDRFEYVDTASPEISRLIFHYVSLATFVGIGFSWFLFLNHRLAWKIPLFFTAGFIVCFMLSLGNKGPLDEYYYSFISDNPVGWIFRSPLKFQLYQGFFISILFTVSMYLLRERFRRYNVLVPLLLMFVLIGNSAYGIYYASSVSFSPISIPNEFTEISNMLRSWEEENSGTFKVVYYPVYNEMPTVWSQGHLISPFDSRSSQVPTFDIFSNYNYVRDFLYGLPYVNGEFNSPKYYDFLNSIGIKYIVFHNDRMGQEDSIIDRKNLQSFLSSPNLEKVYEKNNWYVFEIINYDEPGEVRSIYDLVLVNNSEQIYDFANPMVGVTEVNNDTTSLLSKNNVIDPYTSNLGQLSFAEVSREPVRVVFNGTSSNDVSFSKISPVKWRISVNQTDQRFILAFSETFDRGWLMKGTNGTTSESFPIYGMINGFYINGSNASDINIAYEPQNLFEAGLWISVVFLTGNISFLVALRLIHKKRLEEISPVDRKQ